jgi:peroxiredoxin
MPLLAPGDPFPQLTITAPDADPLLVSDIFADRFGILLFYRGSWCPYCQTQLRGFQRAQGTLTELGAETVAVSVDDEATTRETISKHGLTFLVGHSADADMLAAATGAFVNQEPRYVQSTGFVLDPSGAVIVSVYSSGAIGRLVAEDVVGLIRYIKEHPVA